QAGPKKKTHAWFLGYMPAEKPKYSFIVFLENGGSGGVAAGMFSKISQYMLDNNFFDIVTDEK
ncbi:MAG: penicillin-binding transpeptidase domain-containing protein, partial [Candidatus Omnitrophota bacterium]